MSAERWRAQHERKHAEMERTIQSLRTWLARLSDLHGTAPQVRSFELHYLDEEEAVE